jgi:hypothetical protein
MGVACRLAFIMFVPMVHHVTTMSSLWQKKPMVVSWFIWLQERMTKFFHASLIETSSFFCFVTSTVPTVELL